MSPTVFSRAGTPARVHGFAIGTRMRRAAILLPIALLLGLSACAKGPRTTGSIDAVGDRPLSEAEIEKASAYWGERYARNPKDKAAALNFAAALRRDGVIEVNRAWQRFRAGAAGRAA